MSWERSMDFSPGFEGADELGLLFQAVVKWSLRCISLAEEAQQILHLGTVGVMQKIRPWRVGRRTEQTVQFCLLRPGVFTMQLG